MDITYLGHSSFKIKSKNSSIVCDPYDSSIGLKFPKVDANIVTVSHDHSDHNQIKQVEGDYKVVSGPGEYEIGGVSIFGVPSYHDAKQGEERGRNTIYSITIDGINICHLGDLGHKLNQEQIGDIGNVDILLIPVGGHYTINAGEAVEVVSSLEPKIVIPMHYKEEGLNPKAGEALSGVEDFIKEIGLEPIRDSKLSITSDKLPEEMQVWVLERKG